MRKTTLSTLIFATALGVTGALVSNSCYAMTVDTDLTMDADITTGVVVPSGKSVVIDLNGHNISVDSAKDTIYVENGATLELKGAGTVAEPASGKHANLFNNGNTTINGDVKMLHTVGYYVILNHGVMTINNITIDASKDTNSVVVNGYYNYGTTNERTGYVEGKGIAQPKLTFNGGKINATNKNVTFKTDDNGVTEINGGEFHSTNAGALQNANVTTINGGSFFLENDAEQVMIHNDFYSGGKNAGELTINGGEFSRKTKSEAQPLIAVMDGATTEINRGVFSEAPKDAHLANGAVKETVDGKTVVGFAFDVTVVAPEAVAGTLTMTNAKESVMEGMPVEFKAAAKEGYVVESITATNNDDFTQTVKGDTLTFRMPATNITVTAKFVKKEAVKEDIKNPATGDNIFAVLMTGIASLSGLATVAFSLKR